MKKNCLTCKFEPEWSEWRGVEYRRCGGNCKIKPNKVLLPAWVNYEGNSYIQRYKDNSGIHYNCKTWEAK